MIDTIQEQVEPQGKTEAVPAISAVPSQDAPHQDRVNKEMFRAIELLGRKLERAENERDRLQRRLALIESAATVDDASGKLYLPVVLDPAEARPAGISSRWLVATSLASSAFAVFALGFVLFGAPAPQLTPRQLAALDTLALAQSPATNVDAPALATLAAPATIAVVDAAAPAAVPETPSIETAAKEAAVALKNGAAAADDDIDISQFMPAVAAAPAALNADEAAALPPDTALPPDAKALPQSAETLLQSAEAPPQLAQALAAIEPAGGAPGEDGHAKTVADGSTKAVADGSTKAVADGDAGDMHESATGTKPVDFHERILPLSRARMLDAAGEKLNGEKMTWGMAVSGIARDERLTGPAVALETRAFKGAAEAQHDLGVLYVSGDGAPPDPARALFWFKRAAAAHIADAAYNIGVMHQEGLGVKPGDSQAREWYRKAAQLGHPAALYNLGILYTEGLGVTADVQRGLSYFKQAANAGEAKAAYDIGLLYESGAAGAADAIKAAEWYRVAASAGDRGAKAALARLKVADIEPAAGSIDANEYDDEGYGEGDASPKLASAGAAADEGDGLVRRIQQALALRGDLPPEKTTGFMTPQTADAIRAWQKKLGLAEDGQPTEELLDKIKAAPLNFRD